MKVTYWYKEAPYKELIDLYMKEYNMTFHQASTAAWSIYNVENPDGY